MKTMNILLSAVMVLSFASGAQAASAKKAPAKQINASEDIDSLGGNKDLMEMAGRIQSTSRSRIVQERIVDRHNTLEFGLSYGGVFGGDSYLRTQSIGFAADWHITPRWSLGARYYDFGSSLTPEGERISNANRDAIKNGGVANQFDIDTPQHAMLALINWYPIYGKTSFLDIGVTQFDIYLLGGGGTMTLSRGDSTLLTAGLGIGAWVSRHVSVRTEIRYQKYQDQVSNGTAEVTKRDLDTGVATIGLGWVL